MALSLDISKDSGVEWGLIFQSGDQEGLIMELAPKGQKAGTWDELVSSRVSFGVPLEEYVEAWSEMIKSQGAKIVSMETLKDRSILVKYNSEDENAIWRHFRGTDGVYSIAFQTRPKTEKKERVDLWDKLLREATLGINPL